jgi:cytochrome c oxidase subunit II
MKLSLTDFAWDLLPNLADLVRVSSDSMSFWERMQPPVDISTNGHLIHWLFNYTTYVNLFWFALVCIGLFGFSILYSARRHKKPFYTHGTEKKHYMITAGIGVLVFLSVDMVITKVTTHDMKEVFWNFPADDDKEVIKVQILAQQWLWNIRYAGADGEFNTADDVVTINDLRIPTGKKIMVELTSKDVIHAFYLPNARIKADAIPGRKAKIWFDANIPGKYEIACAEMCGTHHYLMKGNMTVYTPEDYEAWKAETEKVALATNDKEDPTLRWGWKWGSF